MRVGRRIDDQETDTLGAGGMNALDQCALVIALEGFEMHAGGSARWASARLISASVLEP
jgi:hypothetical protein